MGGALTMGRVCPHFTAIAVMLALAGCGARASSPFDGDSETRYRVPIDGSAVRGPTTAWVTIVEFADFQCPYCRQVQPVLSAIMQAYAGKSRLVFKHRPISGHTWAGPAAELSIEARAEQGDDGFWRASNALWITETLSGPALENIGTDLGLDASLVHQAIYANAHADVIKRDLDLAAGLMVDATPYFFINGRRLIGSVPFADFSQMIDEEIAFVGQMIADGADPASVYDDIMQAAQ
jgi:protein-disulfide isomerase